MSTRREPTLRAQWLGQQLRDLREAAGLTLKDAGEYVQRDPSTLSRIEAGLVPARVPDVLALANLYGVDDVRLRDALEGLSRDVWRRGWWEGYAADISGSFIDYAWLEERAQTIKSYEALVLTGLLQTEDYARAVIRAAEPEASTEQIERWVEFRMDRQAVLAKSEPPRLHVILEEAILRRPVGGSAVMRAQLRYLLEYRECPGVEVRVLPLSVGAHASPTGTFVLFELADPFPSVAYADTLAGAVYVESDGARRFAVAWDQLQKAALGPEESAALISAVAEESQ